MAMLDRIAGNRELKQHLKTALACGRLAHSILLVGEPGCGAGFAARCLAADYLYPAGGPHAEAVLRGQDPESITVQGEGASGQIKVERIREAREAILRSAMSCDAAGRALFVYGAQNLNGPSANAMLKTIEEPPDGVLFLLTASSAAAVLPTIRSRCAQYTFSPVSEEECEEYLRRHCPSCSQPALLAAAFGGCIGRALRAGQEGPEAQCFEAARKMVRALAAGREYDLLVLLAGFEKDRPVAQQLLDTFICLCDGALTHGGLEGLSPEEAARAIPLAGGALKALGGYVNTKLVLQNLGAALAGSAG